MTIPKVKNPYRILVVSNVNLLSTGIWKTLLPDECREKPLPVEIKLYFTQSVEEAVSQLEKASYNIVLMCLHHGVETTTRIVYRLKDKRQDAKILVMSYHVIRDDIKTVLDAGASGYIDGFVQGDEFKELIRKAYYNPDALVLSNLVAQILSQGPGNKVKKKNDLTVRQCRVLQMVADGASNVQIAAALKVTVPTIETHRKNILERLEAKTFPHAVKIGCGKGDIDYSPSRDGRFE